MRKFYALVVITILVFSSYWSSAQENERTKFMIWEVQVSPEQLPNLLNAIKTENAFFKEKGVAGANYTNYTNDGTLWYAVPFTKYADLDAMESSMQKLWKDNEEKSKEIGKLFETSYTTVARIMLEFRPDLSVQRPQSETAPTGSRFRYFEKFYLKPGMGDKFEALTKQYIALRKKNGITAGFYTYYPVYGQDMDAVYFIDELGTSPAEHFKLNEEEWKKFGDEGTKLWQEVTPLVRKIESHIGQIDYDLMYSSN